MTRRVVYKYTLALPTQTVATRATAVFRHMDVVNGVPTLWIEQPSQAPGDPEEVWSLRVVGTGHEFSPVEGQQHLGSARCTDTGLVWHVYRLPS